MHVHVHVVCLVKCCLKAPVYNSALAEAVQGGCPGHQWNEIHGMSHKEDKVHRVKLSSINMTINACLVTM